MFRKIIRHSLAVLVVAFIAIQFVPVDRTNPPVTATVAAPEPVMQVLRASCFDCHSNETRWPWYSYVAPVSWLTARDVHKGRDELNFSHWDRYSARHQAEIARECYEEVAEGEMPMWIYTLMHPSARISSNELAILRDWAASTNNEPRAQQRSHDDD